MKLRIKGDSLRYRLTKTDIFTLSDHGFVMEETHFGNAVLSYALKRSAEVKELSSSFVNNTITITIPDSWAEELVKTERVGFDTHFKTGDGKTLYLLIEKDFKCLDETIEDQSDNYDNPIMMKKDEAAD